MSMYKCRLCGNHGHLNDSLVGYYEDRGLCFFCFKHLPEDEREAILQELDEHRKEFVRQRERPPSSIG